MFSSKNGHWGVLGPQGPSLDPTAKFGLFSDPGGLANDVSKAKNLVQIFSGENACFSQSRPVKDIMMLKAAKKMAHTCYNYKTGKDPIDRLTVVWNKIQVKFECCGINSYQDWKNSTFGKTGIIRI